MRQLEGVANAESHLKRALDKINTLVCELRDMKEVVGSVQSELSHVSSRSKAMITCYKGNDAAFYSTHCDNSNNNGRKLTAILYVNSNWKDEFGGQLVVHPSLSTDVTGINTSTSITPLLNRLVLFWSDTRCPHEVRPITHTTSNRYAITIWFIDAIEKQQAIQLEADATNIKDTNVISKLADLTMHEDFDSSQTSTDTILVTNVAQSHDNILKDHSSSQFDNDNTSTSCVVSENDHVRWFWTVSETITGSDDSTLAIVIQFKDSSLWPLRAVINLDVSLDTIKLTLPRQMNNNSNPNKNHNMSANLHNYMIINDTMLILKLPCPVFKRFVPSSMIAKYRKLKHELYISVLIQPLVLP